jgi:glucan phosphoethanolaminetransferase (alkaline phosphatase superfamily)
MGRSEAISPRLLGFIPMLVLLFCLILVLIYRPPFYRAVAFGLACLFVFTAFIFVVVLKKAKGLRREKELSGSGLLGE